jgi:cytochrome c556
MKHPSIAVRIVIGTVAAATLVPLTGWAAPKPKYTTKEIMKALHKGDEALGKKVGKGEGTPDDFKKMVEYYTSLPLNDPPQGDAAEWKKMATARLASAKALEAGKPGALDLYREAVNCKACHSEFKPKDDHK